ncbi:MAG: DUF447 domain-containing protein [Candidatus Hecatellaceae archaeon]
MVSPETLRKLGLQPGRIVETIVASYTAEGKPHAAPMGVLLEGWDTIVIRPYVETWTYRNLESQRQCTVNLTGSPKLFLSTAFKGEPEVGELPEDIFLPASKVKAPRLRNAYGWLEVEISSGEAFEGRGLFKGRILRVKALPRLPEAYCRAGFAAVESIIHATRVLAYSKAGRRGEADRLARLIAGYRSLVSRVAPGSEAEETMEKLASILSRYGFKPEACRELF